MSKRSELLSILTTKKHKEIQKIFGKIRNNTTTLTRERLSDPFKQYSIVEQLLKKHDTKLFITFTSKHIIMGRSFNNEIIDMLKLKIKNYEKSYEGIVPAELNMKYAIMLINIKDERLSNFFIDFFNMKSSKICIENIKYTWVIAEYNGLIIIKYCRILENNELEDVGPCFELEMEDKFLCSEETYKKSMGNKEKVNKNITKNEFNDEIGILHIDKQDLRDIKTRKYRK
ncbi:ribosome production factor 2 RPF2 [Vairimorpha necatrix]|uniref:Ribosome production factor 2 homolog n=1 Tax=Vairimorpha necatrix TaxID=6039 RepID=A0AAX4JGL0_9MICR